MTVIMNGEIVSGLVRTFQISERFATLQNTLNRQYCVQCLDGELTLPVELETG